MKRDELYLGIDLGGVNVRAAVVDAAGHVLGQEKHRLLSKEPPQDAEAVLPAAKTACGAAGNPPFQPKGTGPCAAGKESRAPGLGPVAAAHRLPAVPPHKPRHGS